MKKALLAYRTEQAAAAKAEPVPESREKGFVIENGVLKQYVGLDTDVTVPVGVTTIGKEAFAEFRELRSGKLPESVTVILKGAFNGCTGLTSVTIPDSVKSIEENAFRGCTSLTSVTIPGSVTSIYAQTSWGAATSPA